jgi:hypothetical protein
MIDLIAIAISALAVAAIGTLLVKTFIKWRKEMEEEKE